LGHSISVGFVLAALTTAFDASAQQASQSEKAACIAAAEHGQKMRKEGKLPDAQKDFVMCARPECPSVVKADCAQWRDEVERVVPSIVVEAKDTQGRDLVDVKVYVDGQLVAEKLDGKAIPLPTGEHTLRMEYGTEPHDERKILLREGERERRRRPRCASTRFTRGSSSERVGPLP
jgi:hypothetical protein